jgi:hypothetical protein
MATINPFIQPIDYATEVQSPFEAALGGFKLGSDVATMQVTQQKRELERKALEKAQEKQLELENLFKDPNATAEDYARVTAFLPKDQAEGVRKSFEMMTGEQQQTRLAQSGQIFSALKAGQPEIAKNLLKDQALALRNSGRENDAKAAETYLQLIDLNPTGAQTTIGLMMAQLPGGKEYLENVDKTLGTMRAEAKAPSELTEAQAKADKAVADATSAQATATNAAEKAKADAQKATADAQQAAVKAKYAEREAVDAIVKRASDLGLTKAQTNEVLARTNKLGVETKKAVLELENFKKTGGADPAKVFEQEEKLRKEYQARTKVYGELGTTFSNINASAKAKTGPGDIALITGFMKMLDPGSVVRETEFATARDTAGLYERLLNTSQKLQSGQLFTLDSKQRQEYVDLAQQYLKAAQKKADQDRKDLSAVVTNYKLNPDNVFGPEPVGGGRGPVNPPPANPPAAGQPNVTVDY